MSESNAVALNKICARLRSRGRVSAPKLEVFDFSNRLRERREQELRRENALLARGLSEIHAEIVRLRKLLATS
jgi:hypothetical protein